MPGIDPEQHAGEDTDQHYDPGNEPYGLVCRHQVNFTGLRGFHSQHLNRGMPENMPAAAPAY
jgi:hypothetical protein